MNICRKILPTIVLAFIFSKVYAQQDPQFNMGFMDPTFINPGYAGNTEEGLFNAAAYNRLELTKFDGAPVSTIVSVQGPIDILGVHSGISVTLRNEVAGYLRAPGMNLGYAYRRELGKGQVGVGLSLGFISSWYATTSWRMPDGGTDPVAPTQQNAGVAFDLGAGVYYSDNRWFGGLSFTHLTKPGLGIDDNAHYRPTMYAMGGYTFYIDSIRWMIKPMLNIVSDFTQTSCNIACVAMYNKKYWGGISYRWGQSVAAIVGFELIEALKIGYSYEFPTSQLGGLSGGTHELMLSYSFSVKIVRRAQQYKSIRYL